MLNALSHIDWLQLLTNISAMLGGGVGLWGCIALAKRFQPWLAGKTTLLRVGGMVLAALGVAVTKAATGSLEGADLQTLGLALLQAATVWFTAHSTHKLTK